MFNMDYEENLKKRHKERIKLGLVLILIVGVIAFIDKFFNLGLLG